jgi:CIC family chloride channel protein
MALFVPQVLGVGYGYVGDALNGRMTLGIMALLVVLKLVAVTTSYGSGNAGGIFGPSLFLGAMVGATVGGVAHHWLPAHTASPGAYALVGMGTLFAGIVRAPMTSVLMIFETTQDYAVIVPLMISNLVSLFISSRLQKEPIYEALAYQDGIHLPHGASQRHTDARPVSHLLRPAEEVLDASITVSAAFEKTASSRYRSWPICNSRGVIGVVSRKTIEKAARQEPAKPLGELSNDLTFPHLHADQSPHVALERMGAAGLTLLPVVSRADVHKLEGVVLMHDVLNSYGIGPDED